MCGEKFRVEGFALLVGVWRSVGSAEKAIAKAKEYAQKVPAAHCPCQQMLVVLACNLIQNQNNLASQGQAKLDTPEAVSLTLFAT